MNAVIYFSGGGQCAILAKNLAERLVFELFEYTRTASGSITEKEYSTAVLVFPVYCQSYPSFLKDFFKRLNAKNVAIIAAYGKMSAGNAIYEAAKILNKNVIAAAYVPCNHVYSTFEEGVPVLPESLIDKIKSPSPVALKKLRKTPFAAFLPDLRSRVTIKILRTDKCVGCGKCQDSCPVKGISYGKTNGNCVRCLKCVKLCPHGGLKIKKTRVLERYLSRTRKSEFILFI